MTAPRAVAGPLLAAARHQPAAPAQASRPQRQSLVATCNAKWTTVERRSAPDGPVGDGACAKPSSLCEASSPLLAAPIILIVKLANLYGAAVAPTKPHRTRPNTCARGSCCCHLSSARQPLGEHHSRARRSSSIAGRAPVVNAARTTSEQPSTHRADDALNRTRCSAPDPASQQRRARSDTSALPARRRPRHQRSAGLREKLGSKDRASIQATSGSIGRCQAGALLARGLHLPLRQEILRGIDAGLRGTARQHGCLADASRCRSWRLAL